MARILFFSLVVTRQYPCSGQACLHPASSCLPASIDCMHQSSLSASRLPACIKPACLHEACLHACFLPESSLHSCLHSYLHSCLHSYLHHTCMPACTKPACLPASRLHACLHQACMPASMLQLPASMHAILYDIRVMFAGQPTCLPACNTCLPSGRDDSTSLEVAGTLRGRQTDRQSGPCIPYST
jgi:hypothetical protein